MFNVHLFESIALPAGEECWLGTHICSGHFVTSIQIFSQNFKIQHNVQIKKDDKWLPFVILGVNALKGAFGHVSEQTQNTYI